MSQSEKRTSQLMGGRSSKKKTGHVEEEYARYGKQIG
jgi:hypothetical protein